MSDIPHLGFPMTNLPCVLTLLRCWVMPHARTRPDRLTMHANQPHWSTCERPPARLHDHNMHPLV